MDNTKYKKVITSNNRVRYTFTKTYIKKIIKQRRNALIKELGGKCVRCSTVNNLEFNHKDPTTRTWKASKLNQYSRILRYEKEHKQGLINLMCRSCNLAHECEYYETQRNNSTKTEK